MIPALSTERLVLRAPEDDDAPRFFALFQDPVAARYWFTPDRALSDSYERVRRVRACWAERGFGDWVVAEKASGRFLGFAGLHPLVGMAEVNLGYMLERAAWGRGYATEACRAALAFGLERGIRPIVGVTHPDNAASIRVLRKCGMTYWKDVVRGGLPRVVYRAPAVGLLGS